MRTSRTEPVATTCPEGTTRPWVTRGLVAVLAVMIVASLAVAGHFGKEWLDQRDAPRDMDGNVVSLEPGDVPSHEVLVKMDVEDEVEDMTASGTSAGDTAGSSSSQGSSQQDTQGDADGSGNGQRAAGAGAVGSDQDISRPLRLTAPSVGLDVGVGRLSAVNGTVTPPGFTKAYLVRNIGASPEHNDQGTVYAVMHSVHAGTAPGNRLIDIAAGTPRIANGATVTLGENTYRVTGSERIAKGQLSSNRTVWRNDPDRLVLITCLQRSSGRSLDNVVVYAEKVR